MNDHWPSTKGLSVYNALKLGGPMLPQEVTKYLRMHWSPEVGDAYVMEGIEFVGLKNWIVQDEEGRIGLRNRAMRADRVDDDMDLRLAAGAP